MQYTLKIIHAVFNVGGITEELTFDDFYDMQDYIENNSEEWQDYYITEVEA